jgi:hypothetical protein
MYSRIDFSGLEIGSPTLVASGSHHAPMPRIARPGATSSSVLKVTAINAALRLLLLSTPVPIFTFRVLAASSAAGTIPSRESRPSATQTDSKPFSSATCACQYVCSRLRRSPTWMPSGRYCIRTSSFLVQ